MNNESTFISAETPASSEELFIFIMEGGVTAFDKEEQYTAYLRDNYLYNTAIYEHDLKHFDY
jgi:hypothetical protein